MSTLKKGKLGRGLLPALLLIVSMQVSLYAQSVVVNKFGNGPDDAELLVITDNLDMRGMIVKDYTSNGDGDNGGQYEFSTDTLWASLPSGTLIILRDGSAAAADTDDSDFVLDIGLDNTTYFTNLNGGGSWNISSNEIVQIKAAGSPAAGVTGHIHALIGGTAVGSTNGAAVPAPVINSPTGNSASGEFVAATNSTQSLADFNGTDGLGDLTGLTFGQGHNIDNVAYITALRGIVADDPDISAPSGPILVGTTDPNVAVTFDVVITNLGTGSNLDVTNVVYSDGRFSTFGSLPTGIATSGGTDSLTIEFDPGGGSLGVTTATATITSNDSGGDIPVVNLEAVTTNLPAYAGLIISEVITGPFQDEVIEVFNASASTIDISGVILSDEETGGGEGALAFPPATTIDSGEIIVVAVGTDNDPEPSWLDSVPGTVDIYYHAGRDISLWTPANGQTPIEMLDWDASIITGNLNFGTADSAVMYPPNIQNFQGTIDWFPDFPIDGMNTLLNSTGTPVPINTTGQVDTPATRAGTTSEPAAGDSYARNTINANTSSQATFTVGANSVGTTSLIAVPVELSGFSIE